MTPEIRMKDAKGWVESKMTGVIKKGLIISNSNRKREKENINEKLINEIYIKIVMED